MKGNPISEQEMGFLYDFLIKNKILIRKSYQ